MTAPAARQPLPVERDDPLDAVLDLIEANIELAIGLGLEAPLRARFARLLPAPSDARSSVAPSDAHVVPEARVPHDASGAWMQQAPSEDQPSRAAPSLDPLDLAAILTACRDVEQLKLRAGQHAAIARLKAWIVAGMEAAHAPGARAGAELHGAGCASGQPKAHAPGEASPRAGCGGADAVWASEAPTKTGQPKAQPK